MKKRNFLSLLFPVFFCKKATVFATVKNENSPILWLNTSIDVRGKIGNKELIVKFLCELIEPDKIIAGTRWEKGFYSKPHREGGKGLALAVFNVSISGGNALIPDRFFCQILDPAFHTLTIHYGDSSFRIGFLSGGDAGEKTLRHSFVFDSNTARFSYSLLNRRAFDPDVKDELFINK